MNDHAIRGKAADAVRGGLIGLSVLVFVMLRVLPGDVAAVIAGTNATPERIASLRAELGLDKPLVAQYGDWILGLVHGDLGVSAIGGKSVAQQVAARAGVTFPLIVLSLLIALAIGLPLGCAAVLTRNPHLRGLFHGIAIVAGGSSRIVGWSAADSAVLPRFGSAGTASCARIPGRRLVGSYACARLVDSSALTTGITAGASIMRVHACRGGGYGLLSGRWIWPWPAA